jgi:hypothetical protein
LTSQTTQAHSDLVVSVPWRLTPLEASLDAEHAEFHDFEPLRLFDSYGEAASCASELARAHRTPMLVRRSESGFCVYGPRWVKGYLDELRRRSGGDGDDWSIDEEERQSLESVITEGYEYAEDVERSNEEGWFYPE